MPVYTAQSIAPAGTPITARSGAYSFPGASSSTSAGLGVGTLRAAPVYVPRPVTLDRIGAEVAIIGDVGSKLRLGIYADNGNLYPGALLLAAGTINGDSATVQEITISLTLAPGVYWLAGVVQVVTVAQPTVRIALEIPFCPIVSAVDLVAGMGADTLGLMHFTVLGSLPATFTTTPNRSGFMPRIFVRAV